MGRDQLAVQYAGGGIGSVYTNTGVDAEVVRQLQHARCTANGGGVGAGLRDSLVHRIVARMIVHWRTGAACTSVGVFGNSKVAALFVV